MARRSKRLFPKAFSSTSVKTSRLDANAAAAYNSQRSAATIGSRGNTEHKLGNSFTQDIPETHHPRWWHPTRNKWYYLPLSPKIETIKTRNEVMIVENSNLFSLYRVWQGQRGQGVDQFYCTVLEQHAYYKCMLFFSGNEYIIVLENESSNTRMISDTYRDRADILQRKKENRLRWIITESISLSKE